LLGVGRLSVEKNFAALVGAFGLLAPRHPDWDLVILGEGPARAALEAQVRDAGLQGRVFLPGRVGNPGEWYGHAALYGMSSDFEGFPNTLVEAMACGLPAVSFDCDTGPRDIIRHGLDGLLVPPGQAALFGAALDLLMSNDELRRAFASRATQVRERFAMPKVAAMWEALFACHCVQRPPYPAAP
jgi:glycosyltransferase involved in cell wall biosynthesis